MGERLDRGGEIVRAVLLGSGGWIPTSHRETCCLMIKEDGYALLMDAGTGVRHLVERPELLDDAHELNVVLTHFHLDHIVGLSYLPAIAGGRPVRIWAPGERLYDTRSATILERVLGAPVFALSLDEVASAVTEIGARDFEIGPFSVASRAQEAHSHPTLAFRLGDWLTYCTDTAFDPENAAFAHGAARLLHEAWHPTATTDDRTHSAAGEAGRVAAEAGVHDLILIHINPGLSDESELLGFATKEFPAATVGHDLLALN